MYVLLSESCDINYIPDLLRELNRPKSVDELLAAFLKSKIRDCKIIEGDLELQKRKVVEAQHYYRYNRFWGSIAEQEEVHIFTCGRDIPYDPHSSRGKGGRTNIDMWDYRSVLDINRFFASNYPNTKIKIEEPVSKLPSLDIEDIPRLSNRIAYMRSMLEDKNCIIIGSPDVSDFAEIVLAEIHQIVPYTTTGRVKKKGFVIVKEKMDTRSAVYWATEGKDQEGVIQIIDENENEPFPHELNKQEGYPGKMHGILIVTNNPFYREKKNRKIIILSGFSGVATNAIAKLLTDEKYLKEFYRLDNAYVDTDRAIEALIGVDYDLGRNFDHQDTRIIKNIHFERLVEI